MATTTTNSSTIEITSISGSGGTSTATTKVLQLNIGLPAAQALLESSGVSGLKRHELLARQPSYCKILNDLKEVDPVDEDPPDSPPSPHPPLFKKSPPTSVTMKDEVIELAEAGEVRQSHQTLVINGQSYQIVTPTLTTGGGGVSSDSGLENTVLSIQNSGSSDSGFTNASVFLPSSASPSGAGHHQVEYQPGEEQARKREIRLLKNREAARECRNKKKEYIKCLENRVAVLENQNKALIEELKLLKELYKSNN
jgi:hypothetical protein